jgi:hypothetical protein
LVDTFVSSVHFLCKPLLIAHFVADCQLMALTYDEHRVGKVRCIKAFLLITNRGTCQAKRTGDLTLRGLLAAGSGITLRVGKTVAWLKSA